MKVFKMNEIDWVCSESEQEAKQYYHEIHGESWEDIEECFEGEVSLEETMFVELCELSDIEKAQPQKMREFSGEMFVKMPFSWVINHYGKKHPHVIASSEE